MYEQWGVLPIDGQRCEFIPLLCSLWLTKDSSLFPLIDLIDRNRRLPPNRLTHFQSGPALGTNTRAITHVFLWLVPRLWMCQLCSGHVCVTVSCICIAVLICLLPGSCDSSFCSYYSFINLLEYTITSCCWAALGVHGSVVGSPSNGSKWQLFLPH